MDTVISLSLLNCTLQKQSMFILELNEHTHTPMIEYDVYGERYGQLAGV